MDNRKALVNLVSFLRWEGIIVDDGEQGAEDLACACRITKEDAAAILSEAKKL